MKISQITRRTGMFAGAGGSRWLPWCRTTRAGEVWQREVHCARIRIRCGVRRTEGAASRLLREAPMWHAVIGMPADPLAYYPPILKLRRHAHSTKTTAQPGLSRSPSSTVSAREEAKFILRIVNRATAAASSLWLNQSGEHGESLWRRSLIIHRSQGWRGAPSPAQQSVTARHLAEWRCCDPMNSTQPLSTGARGEYPTVPPAPRLSAKAPGPAVMPRAPACRRAKAQTSTRSASNAGACSPVALQDNVAGSAASFSVHAHAEGGDADGPLRESEGRKGWRSTSRESRSANSVPPRQLWRSVTEDAPLSHQRMAPARCATVCTGRWRAIRKTSKPVCTIAAPARRDAQCRAWRPPRVTSTSLRHRVYLLWVPPSATTIVWSDDDC